jgi:hypothetical protein
MKVFKALIYISLLSSFLGSSLYGQGFYNRNAWKKHRHELNIGLGVSNFLGEVGGRDKEGTNFIWDLEFSKTNFAAQFNYQYYLGQKVALRTSFTYGKVSGDDALTAEPFRHNRNLSFQSIILEGGLGIEYQFLKEKVGNVYNLKSSTGKKLGTKSFSLGMYVTAGIAGFYYNPKAVAPDGSLVALRPLKTEGQGLPGGAEEYGKFNVAIPIGLGIRRSLGRTIGIKVELTHRFTFTDYIDDVSTVYYDRGVLASEVGGLSPYFSNPQLGEKPNYVTRAGQQRGDPNDRDGYMFFIASLYIKLETKPKAYGRHKVRRVKASF